MPESVGIVRASADEDTLCGESLGRSSAVRRGSDDGPTPSAMLRGAYAARERRKGARR